MVTASDCASVLVASTLAVATAGCGLLAGLEDHGLATGAGPADAAAGGVSVLAEGQALAHALKVDDTRVYWATEGPENRGIWSMSKDGGGEVVNLASLIEPNPTQVKLPIKLALDVDNIYWTQDNGDGGCTPGDGDYTVDQVMSTRKDGSSEPTEIWHECPRSNPKDLVVDGRHVVLSQDRHIVRVRKEVLDSANLGEDQYFPYGMALDPVNVYWIVMEGIEGAIRRIPIVGARDSATIYTFNEALRVPNAIAVDETTLYWVDNGRVLSVDKTSKDSPVLPLVDLEGTYAAIALDDDYVYWTDVTQGRILRVRKQGGDVETLASEQNDPEAIAVDETSIYWTDFSRGTVVKMPKP